MTAAVKKSITRKIVFNKYDEERFQNFGVIDTSIVKDMRIGCTSSRKNRLSDMQKGGVRLDDIINISVGTQTLADSVFILVVVSRESLDYLIVKSKGGGTFKIDQGQFLC